MFEELPGIPGIWVDFAAGSRTGQGLLPSRPDMQLLLGQAAKARALPPHGSLNRLLARGVKFCSARIQEGTQRLDRSNAVVVVTNYYAGLFGGPAFQILKCLTAAKLCDDLAKHGVTAIPVCWISRERPPGFPMASITLLDSASELHILRLLPSDKTEFSPTDDLPSGQISELLSQIEELGRDAFDAEILDILRTSYFPGASFASASVSLVSALLRDREMIVFDPYAPELEADFAEAIAPFRVRSERIKAVLQDQETRLGKQGYAGESRGNALPTFLVQSSMLPVIANVIDPYELYSFSRALPVFDEFGWMRPVAWPGASATIVDARSRRILKKHRLTPGELFAGAEKATKKQLSAMPPSVLERLGSLKADAESRIAKLGASFIADDGFVKARDSFKEKIVYQIGKTMDRFDAAREAKQQAMSRQIRQVCNFLAPNERLQEREVAGIQFLLRYSPAVIGFLYEKLDISSFKHQLIFMD